MRLIGFILAAGLVMGGSSTLAAQTTPTGFVYVNTQRLLESAPGAQAAQDTWNRELVQMQEEVRVMRSELDSLLADYRRQETMLSDAARQTRQEEMAAKQGQLQQRTMELENQANQRRQELLGPILESVQAEIENFRAERGYVMVFDASAAGLIAADPALDVTDDVIARLQAQAPASSRQP